MKRTLTAAEHRLVDETIGHQATADGRRLCTRCREAVPWTPTEIWLHAQKHLRAKVAA